MEAGPHKHAWPPSLVKAMLNNSVTHQYWSYSLSLYGYRFEVNQMPHLLLIKDDEALPWMRDTCLLCAASESLLQ